MADTKFTTGPWKVGDKHRDCQIFHGSDSVAFAREEFGRISSIEAKANAHLIAASPELYEALYRLVRDCEIAGLQEQAGFDCWINMANAALAKARGEVPT